MNRNIRIEFIRLSRTDPHTNLNVNHILQIIVSAEIHFQTYFNVHSTVGVMFMSSRQFPYEKTRNNKKNERKVTLSNASRNLSIQLIVLFHFHSSSNNMKFEGQLGMTKEYIPIVPYLA